jgi:hypothetical protein
MRRSALAVSLCCILALGFAGCDSDEDTENFIATLTGAAEVPPTGSTATGSATIERDGNTVTFDVEVSGITAVTMAHIHSGAAGVNGPIRVNLFLGPTTGALTGQLVEGSFSTSDVMGISYEALLAELRAGTAYVNVHTTAFPAGEIRGQVQLQ